MDSKDLFMSSFGYVTYRMECFSKPFKNTGSTVYQQMVHSSSTKWALVEFVCAWCVHVPPCCLRPTVFSTCTCVETGSVNNVL